MKTKFVPVTTYLAPVMKVVQINSQKVCSVSTGGFDSGMVSEFGEGEDDWD